MLEVNNLKISHQNRDVLKGVTFDVRLNQIVGISGAIASGKSSIFETILNFREFSNGTIIYENKKVAYNNRNHILNLRKNIGYLSQKDYFLNKISLFDNFRWICKISEDRVIELASLTGITDILYNKTDSISQTEKIRFKLALSLVENPHILFIDEPLESLNIDEIEDFLDTVEDIAKSLKIGVVIASQEIEKFKKDRFDKIYILEKGLLNAI